MDLLHLFHDTLCGAIAAAGFGVLFNFSFQAVPWCAASGGLALALRTAVLAGGWSMEAASFLATVVVGFALQLLPSRMKDSRNALHVAGCIPMVPGGFATKAILGLFAITVQNQTANYQTLLAAINNALRVMLTIGAIGTGLAISIMVVGMRGTNRLSQNIVSKGQP